MANQPEQLLVSIGAGPDADREEIEALARQLREDFLELGVQDANFASGSVAPATAKGVPVDFGALLVTLAASGGVLTTLINMIQSWVARGERRTITVEMDGDKLAITGISSEEQGRLIDAWLSRHKRR